MDAYDEDSQARPGPGGPAGARRLDPGDREGPPAGEAAGDPDRDPAGDCSGGHDRDPAGDCSGDPEAPDRAVAEVTSVGPDGPSDAETAGGTDAPLAGEATEDGPDGPPAGETAAGGPDGAPPSESPPLPPPPRTGVAALSPRYQVGAAIALAVIAVAACVHLGMVFLSLAPANTVTKQHGEAIEQWVYPEFEQNWKLFAPNPLQQNIAVQVRAEVRMKDGSMRTTAWNDLSARDGAAIDGSLVPSHTQQNELRRAWDFFVATHGSDNRSVGMRGALSEQYVRRIVVMRLYREDAISREGVVQRVQIRSSTTNVQPPKWSRERVSDKPVYRLLPWWTVSADEAAGGVR
ncbi:DUF5819 family protein [Streptomyces sp. NPDC007971]|uniref:DUF5819 family protein n=1 Tax=Streptomyces sp. NPDC007971 TaxID=3364799 RepID=UPI0036EC66CB